MRPMFALVDCNNFYASCERLFAPHLVGRPLVVLSNNDGCVIARSNEAKALGIPMGAPYFQCEPLIRQHGVQVFSSNYALYGDLSHRVMTVLRQQEPEIEIYSIDEAFISLPPAAGHSLTAHGRQLKTTVQQYTGIPVSIGIGPTKTLAKIANRAAKKNADLGGVFTMPAGDEGDRLLAAIEAADVWGIGRRHGRRLLGKGIRTALDLKNGNDAWLRKNLTVMGLRTAMELRGVPCFTLEKNPPAKQSIASARSFGRPVTSLTELKEAVATYVAVAAEKLRRQNSAAGGLQVYITTNRFHKDDRQYSGSQTVALPEPTGHTGTLIRHALAAVSRLYRSGYRYQKAGILLVDLSPRDRRQYSLFQQPAEQEIPLMQALDRINKQWGRRTIHYGATGFSTAWHNRQNRKSPAYTTHWDQLPVARASSPA